MAQRKLRAVQPGDVPVVPEAPMSLVEAVETGDYRKILVAQRREIALSLPDEKGPAKAALHRQLSLIAKELAALDQRDIEGGSDLEPIADEEWQAI